MSESDPTVESLGFSNVDHITDAQYLIRVLRSTPEARVRVRHGIDLQEHDAMYRRPVGITTCMIERAEDRAIMKIENINANNKIMIDGVVWQPSMLEAVLIEEIVTVL